MSLDSFAEILTNIFGRGGGRRPESADQPPLELNTTWSAPCEPSAARLTIVQITDVYTLDNFASLKTLLEHIRASQGSTDSSNKVISMLTGDFLAPYLLSSIDRGAGMMQAVRKTPIDYLTWGNHEADIDHRTVCRHVKNYPGIFINSNMTDHEAMEYQQEYDVLTIQSADGTHTRKVGLTAVLSDDPKLYSHFKPPGAFGGATIQDPWKTLQKYKELLENEHGCDLVIPLEHLYVPENTKTCEEFDFPVILSGHDHHRIDQVINGTRLIKPGMDGVFATVLEVEWENADSTEPTIRSTFVDTTQYDPDPVLKQEMDACYGVLAPLRNTMLAAVLPKFEPLSSKNARGSTCSMGKLVCTMLRVSMQQSRRFLVDAVILMGGNIRGNQDYPEGSFFSLETLEAEIKQDEVIGVVMIPGSVLAEGIEATHAGDPIPGWFQYDDGIVEEDGRITTVAGRPINRNRLYRVATKIKDLTNGQSPPLTEYFKAHPDVLPAKGSYINIHAELMGFFARNLFRRLWEATGKLIPDPEAVLEEADRPQRLETVESRLRLSVLDRDDDGVVTVDDIHEGLKKFLGLSVDDSVKTLAEYVHQCADATGSGTVTVEDFEEFCVSMPAEFDKVKGTWQSVFPEPLPEVVQAETVAEKTPSGSFVVEKTASGNIPLKRE